MMAEPFYDGDEKYEVVARGICGMCNRYVWSDQPRIRDPVDSKYYHDKCPIRCGGRVEELKKWDKYWVDRAEQWEKKYGKNYFVSKKAFKRPQ